MSACVRICYAMGEAYGAFRGSGGICSPRRRDTIVHVTKLDGKPSACARSSSEPYMGHSMTRGNKRARESVNLNTRLYADTVLTTLFFVFFSFLSRVDDSVVHVSERRTSRFRMCIRYITRMLCPLFISSF